MEISGGKGDCDGNREKLLGVSTRVVPDVSGHGKSGLGGDVAFGDCKVSF